MSGKGVPLKATPPVLRVPPAAPAALLLFGHAPSGVGEGGNTLDPTLFGQRVSAGSGELAVGERQFAGIGDRDEPGGAESEFAASSANGEPLDPASDAGRLD